MSTEAIEALGSLVLVLIAIVFFGVSVFQPPHDSER
jgi:hypothetical protein